MAAYLVKVCTLSGPSMRRAIASRLSGFLFQVDLCAYTILDCSSFEDAEFLAEFGGIQCFGWAAYLNVGAVTTDDVDIGFPTPGRTINLPGVPGAPDGT